MKCRDTAAIIGLVAIICVGLLFNASTPLWADSQSDFDQGWQLFNDGNYDLARASFSKVDHASALAPKAARMCALCLIWKGEVMAAIPELTAVRADFPQSDDAAEIDFWIGHCYDSIGQFDTAMTYYAQQANANPSSRKTGEALYKLGWLYLKKHQQTEALVQYERVISEYPDLADDAMLQTVECYLEMHDRDTAIDKLRAFPAAYPASDRMEDAKFMLGERYEEKRLYNDAITQYEAITRDHPNRTNDARVRKSICNLALKEYSKAINDLRDALVADPDRGDAKWWLAQCLTQFADSLKESGELSAAMDLYTQCIEEFPDQGAARDAVTRAGAIFRKDNQYEEELAFYDSIIQDHPQLTVQARIERATVYLLQGQRDQSVAELERAFKENPEDDSAPEAWARCLRQKYCDSGDYTGAMAECNRVITEEPNDAWTAVAYSNLGRIYEELWSASVENGLGGKGYLDLAEEQFNTIIDEFNDNDELVLTAMSGLGECALMRGDRQADIDIAKRMLVNYPTSGWVDYLYCRLGTSYQALHDEINSRGCLQRAIALYPYGEWAPIAADSLALWNRMKRDK